MTVRLCLMFVGLVLARSPAAQAQGIPCSYSVTVLPRVDCGVFDSPGNPVSINNFGHVLLTAACADYDRTYLWTGGDTLTILPIPPGALSFTGTDLNDVGQVVGSAEMPSGTGRRGCVFDMNSGQWTIMPPLNPPSGWSSANAITNDGTVCGTRSIGSKGSPIDPQTAFRWSLLDGFSDVGLLDGRSTAARDINNLGLVSVSTGFSSDAGARGYLWRADGTLEPLGPVPDGITSSVGRLNDQGWVTVGGMIQQNPLILAAYVRRSDRVFVPLPPLPTGSSSGLLSLSSSGVVTGHTNFTGSGQSATTWRSAEPVDVETTVASSLIGTLYSARMNNLETILAIGEDVEGQDRVFVLTPKYAIDGDANCDGMADIDDLLSVIGHWGPCAGCNADLTRNGAVDIADLTEVITYWTSKGGAP